jgi:multiple sugar transport system permease protein
MKEARALPYLMLLPSTLFLAVFFLWPLVQVTIEAFTVGGASGPTLANFQEMASNWKFLPALKNTLILAAIIVPAQLVLGIAMASLVMGVRRGREILLYILSIPLGISDLAAGLIWLAILQQNGFLNSALVALHVVDHPTNLLAYQNYWTMIVAVILAELWRSTAIVLVILVAGLGLIPKEYYEAAEVFGAGPWKRFVKVTLPLLKPSIQTALILRTILAFEVFAVVAALAGTQLPVLVGETYQWQFALQDRKVASAYALVILAISVAFTLFYLRALRTRDEARP